MRAHLVCGPPGSGKTTWVAGRRRWGDVVADLDTLFAAVTGLPLYEKPDALVPLAMLLHAAVVDWVIENPERAMNAWIIAGGANVYEREMLARKLSARVIVLEVSPDECLRRIAADPRRGDKVELWRPVVGRWWAEYRRGDYTDMEVIRG